MSEAKLRGYYVELRQKPNLKDKLEEYANFTIRENITKDFKIHEYKLLKPDSKYPILAIKYECLNETPELTAKIKRMSIK